MSRHTITHADEIGVGNMLIPNRRGESVRGINCFLMQIDQFGTVLAVDVDGVAESQTPGAGGQQDLVLDGAFVTDGIATIPNLARNLSITAAANETARTFTVIGFDVNGFPQIEEITGPNATRGDGGKDWSRVTRIFVDADTAGAVQVGDANLVFTRLRNGLSDQDDEAVIHVYLDNLLTLPAGSAFTVQHTAPTATSISDRMSVDISDANWGFGNKYTAVYVGDLTKEGNGRTFNG